MSVKQELIVGDNLHMGALLRSDYVKIQYLFLIDAGNIVQAQFFVSNLYVRTFLFLQERFAKRGNRFVKNLKVRKII